MVVTTAYVVVVGYGATQLANVARLPLHTDPTHYGLQYQNVSFTSREDHVQLVGWFIPGILPDKSLTTQRTIIMVHGYPGNRVPKVLEYLILPTNLCVMASLYSHLICVQQASLRLHRSLWVILSREMSWVLLTFCNPVRCRTLG